MQLSDAQRHRYDRNIRLLGFGEVGQLKLLDARVLVIGAGGLGSAALLYLAAAGVGTLGIVDGDTVEDSNLQRQVLYGRTDVGRLKAEAARDRIDSLNPDVGVVALAERVSPVSIADLIAGYDFVVECTDNAATKFLVNDACVASGKPFCHGGVLGLSGKLMTYVPGHACARCAFEPPVPSATPTADDVGVLGAAAGVIGSMQAAEAIKHLTGCGRPLIDTLLHVDLADDTFARIAVKRDRACAAYGTRHGASS